MLTMNKELALRIEQSEIDHFSSWISLLHEVDGNPLGIKSGNFGQAVAFANQDASLGPLFNRVFRMSEDAAAHLSELRQFYSELGVGLRIDVNPYQTTPKLFGALSDFGLRPFRYHSHLYASPADIQPAASLSNNVVARRISIDEAEIWSSVWQQSFTEVLDVSPDITKQIVGATRKLGQCPGWTLYIATQNGEPAGAAALYVENGIATPVIGGTLPQFRRKGCQAALLQARLTDAIAGGCDLIVAQAALGSSSQNNLERAGLKVAYTRAFWWLPLQSRI